jgi:hypothetical protein
MMIELKILVNSIVSFRRIPCSYLKFVLLISKSLSQYALSFASLRHILILIKKSFFPKDSLASIVRSHRSCGSNQLFSNFSFDNQPG